MKKYQNVSDEDLIDLIHQGNVEASDILFFRYHHYSWRLAYEFDIEHPNSGITLEDYRQVAFSMVVVCLKKYLDTGSFYPYWKKSVQNELMEYFLDNSYTASAQVYKGVPLDDDRYSMVAEEIGEIDFGVTEQIIHQEIFLIKEVVLKEFDSKKDKEIINLFIDGLSFEEIQEKTDEKSRHINELLELYDYNSKSDKNI